MKTYLIAAVALVAALFQPASATTFPTLTTIYIGSGVKDNGGIEHEGTGTAFSCTNVSGVAANVRFLVLDTPGTVAGTFTTSVNHGATFTAATHLIRLFSGTPVSPGVEISQGGVNIESTQSGVFCTAMIVDASASQPNGIDLHLVRVNPHPGTVE